MKTLLKKVKNIGTAINAGSEETTTMGKMRVPITKARGMDKIEWSRLMRTRVGQTSTETGRSVEDRDMVESNAGVNDTLVVSCSR